MSIQPAGARVAPVLRRRGSDGLLTMAAWIAGPAAAAPAGRLLVSVTDFEVAQARALPRIWLEGLRLRHAWPGLAGAVGLWLWAKPLRKRSGSVSVWQSEEDLRAFVRWPRHVEIMRRYRNAGSLTATTWWTECFDPAEIWAIAEQQVARGGHELAQTSPRA
jgi:hypothetical protein